MEKNQDEEKKAALARIEAQADRVLCEHSFYEFIKAAWQYVDHREFIDDWHIELIADHLQWSLEDGLKRLIINIPPGCAKSLLCSVLFPVWLWIKAPHLKLLTGSHTVNFAIRDTVKSRNLILSEWFQSNWGYLFRMASDQNQKTVYMNDKFGERRLFSTGAGVTGARGDFIIYDDPINATDIYSATKIEACNLFYSETLSSRSNDPKESVVIVIMQRLHSNDLTGYLLDQGGWDHLCLPMRFEPDSANQYDPRIKEGEKLTKLHDDESLERLERDLGIYATASQLQQKPSPREGGFIKLEWIKYYTELPEVKSYTWSWDTAIKPGQHNDFSVGLLWAECHNGHYLVDMWRKKVEYPELKIAVETNFQSQKSKEVLVEDKASGQQIVQDFRRTGLLPVIAMVPGKNMGKSKEERVNIAAPLFEAGKLFLPKDKPWIRVVIDEIVNFPNAPHDDILDTITQYAARKLASREIKVTILG